MQLDSDTLVVHVVDSSKKTIKVLKAYPVKDKAGDLTPSKLHCYIRQKIDSDHPQYNYTSMTNYFICRHVAEENGVFLASRDDVMIPKGYTYFFGVIK